jgi:hypothetical protein
LRWSDGGVIPFGDAAAAAIAPALVSASAMAATAAVRLPLHRGFSAGGATAAGAAEAFIASCGTLSWISARGGCGIGTVGDGRGGTVNPGGSDAGGGTVTPAGCGRSL